MTEPEKALTAFHPLMASWFEEAFGRPTDVQVRSWKAIGAGDHTLIAAPTGSGKTLAALLPCLNAIAEAKLAAGEPLRGVKLLYITPLKALNNDIHHHAVEFIRQLMEKAEAEGAVWPGLSSGVRTGDTTQSARASMVRQPPDVLVTTPESLYIMLTSMKGREMLRTVQFAIVDEIHDLAADRRGLHLSVTLERLTELCGRTPQRIGVSATQKPIERVASFLGGFEHAAGTAGASERRHVEIIESRMEKSIRLYVTMPEQTLIAKDKQEAVWGPLTDKIFKLLEDSRSALIFVNNRRLCERLTLRLNEHVGYEMARSHHGSVSREQRLEVERALKEGELHCLVATSSLELGIDVGYIDLVLQIDSPKSAAAGIQRIGRAGHAVGGESRGVIIARSRGQLAECAVLARDIAARNIEEIVIPRYSLDVLCQQTVAMVAAEDWDIARLHAVLARSYGYNGFPRERFEAVLQVLSGYYPFVRPLIEWDRETGRLYRRSATAMAAIMGAGTIPQGSAYPVHHAESRIHLGELDEEYIHESRVGDVFQLGTSSWKIQSVRSDRVYVVEAGNTFSEIPFWRGEGQGRTVSFSLQIGRFMAELEVRTDSEDKYATQEWLMAEHCLDAHAAEELVTLIHAQKAVSAVPTHRRIVIEQFQDDMKRQHLVIHSLFGRTFNRTWQLAIQLHMESRLPFRLYATAKDNGIEFMLSEGGAEGAARMLPLLREVTSERLEALLRQAVPASPLFGAAFRRLAETSLLLSRSFTRMPGWKKRLRSEELLRESLPYAEQFPFIGEAMRLCLQEDLDMGRVKVALAQLESGELEVVVRQSGFPSPMAAIFTADFINVQMYESDAVSRDLQAHLLGVDRSLAGRLFGEQAIQELLGDEEAEQAGTLSDADSPVTADELLRLLKRHGDMTSEEAVQASGNAAASAEWMTMLSREGKIRSVQLAGEQRWIVSDEAETYAAFPGDPLAERFVLTRYIERGLDFTASQLGGRFGLERAKVESLLKAWEDEGRIEPSPRELGEPAWISRQAASRRIRSRVEALRSEAAPVDPVRYCSAVLKLQHVEGEDRLSGEEGLRQMIGKLQGLFLPLSQWESSVFPLRLPDYRKETLDLLCAGGEVIWFGRKEPEEKEGRVAFFLTESKELYAPLVQKAEQLRQQQAESPLLDLLERKGASFLSALSRETDKVPSELTAELIGLAWEGLVSNDQFAPLRLNGASASSGKGAGKSTAAGRAGRGRTSGAGSFQSGLGRWYAVSSLADASFDANASLAAWVHHLLGAFGFLTRDIAAAHLPWSWDDAYDTLKRLEQWGMLTRGLWVQEVPTMQFSTPELVRRLRGQGWEGGSAAAARLLPSTDPANPFGFSAKWPSLPDSGMSFARKAGNDLVLKEGRWLLWIEGAGKRMFTLHELSGYQEEWLSAEDWLETLRTVARAYLRQPGVRKLVVETWNGEPVRDSAVAELFLKLGAEADQAKFVLWPSAIK
ncbi:DEAD/DEAH box helicase [Paenibacillus allorhizosphaerae]|uniref:ATP-dependent RNA helicase SrmB n=1 Tax=Paenibacillus allorhizosphaerae TaxID=2849866 RepID=A0ABN7TMQ9_9BACL|nr:DEAD/DEAH box helicase [Paenibacillus allorhizosphaerae]CAG7647530.1 ATP-dependent RNA helicase SrmB [Paenibacillus allorhizosphaerae]